MNIEAQVQRFLPEMLLSPRKMSVKTGALFMLIFTYVSLTSGQIQDSKFLFLKGFTSIHGLYYGLVYCLLHIVYGPFTSFFGLLCL